MELILDTMKKYQRTSEVGEKEATTTNSEGRVLQGKGTSTSGVNQENNIYSTSANLMFLSGVIGTEHHHKDFKKLKVD